MKKVMRREEKSKIVRDRILDTSRDLFILKGYKAATTREIIEKAGITTGTLYHFFRDKEDIFLNIVIATYEDAMKAAETIIGRQSNSSLQYATIYALEMKAIQKYYRVAELYLESYSSWRVTEVMLPVNIERNKVFFNKYNPDFTDQDYFIKTLALRGMRLSFIMERVFSGKVDYRAKCAFLIKEGLSLFNVPDKEGEEAVTRALDLTSKNSLTIHGFSI